MTNFAEHFPFVEFSRVSRHVGGFTDAQLEYAARLSQLLELFRAELGGRPIVVTSWLRDDSDTQHGDGAASDQLLPPGRTERDLLAAADRLEARGVKWGQLIVYPYTAARHWHIALPTGQARNVRMIQLYDTAGDAHDRTAYRTLTAELAANLPTDPASPAGAFDVLVDVATAAPTTGTMGALLFALGVALMVGG